MAINQYRKSNDVLALVFTGLVSVAAIASLPFAQGKDFVGAVILATIFPFFFGHLFSEIRNDWRHGRVTRW